MVSNSYKNYEYSTWNIIFHLPTLLLTFCPICLIAHGGWGACVCVFLNHLRLSCIVAYIMRLYPKYFSAYFMSLLV